MVFHLPVEVSAANILHQNYSIFVLCSKHAVDLDYILMVQLQGPQLTVQTLPPPGTSFPFFFLHDFHRHLPSPPLTQDDRTKRSSPQDQRL